MPVARLPVASVMGWVGAAAVAGAVLLVPAVGQLHACLGEQATWVAQQSRIDATACADFAALVEEATQAGGQIYAVAVEVPEGGHDMELKFRGFPVLGRLLLSALGLGTIALLYVLDRRDCNAAAAESDD